MYCSGHVRVLILSAAVLLLGADRSPAEPPQRSANAQNDGSALVNLHWSPRPGVTRFRLQISRDRSFADIVLDRVVPGTDYRTGELMPGRYFWRVAPLTAKLGEFSSPAPIEIRPPAAADAAVAINPSASPLVTRGGWRAAVGDIAHPIPARLRSPDKLDLIGINSEGVVFGLDSASGIALWRTNPGRPSGPLVAAPLLLRSKSGLDDAVVLSGAFATAIEGKSGRLLWRAVMPANAAAGAVLYEGPTAQVFVIDASRQGLIILNARDGKVLSQIRLPNRVVGAPITTFKPGARVTFAYENGQVEMRAASGIVVRSGDAGSPATTAAVYVKGRSGDLILIGTRAGLTALTAAELRPLGMVAIKEDAPRGVLTAQDLDADGFPEVIMMTDRGRVIAVNAADGKTLWDAALRFETGALAFVDVNGDQVLDVLVAGGRTFALALSGRDGSVVWKDNDPSTFLGNHAGPAVARSVMAVPFGSGALVIAGDPSRTGLRAIEFLRARLNR